MNYQDIRVLRRNLLYCYGVPVSLTEDQLKSNQYFGQYGKIEKLIKVKTPNRFFYSVYITYSHQLETSLALLACNEYEVSNSVLLCLFGTVKYCKFFLERSKCKHYFKCHFLHAFDKENEISINNPISDAFPEHQKIAIEVLKKHPKKLKLVKALCLKAAVTRILPSPGDVIEDYQQQTEDQNKESQPKSQNREDKFKQNSTQKIQNEQGLSQVVFETGEMIIKKILYNIERGQHSKVSKLYVSKNSSIKRIIKKGLLELY